jgi:hypothetical protein
MAFPGICNRQKLWTNELEHIPCPLPPDITSFLKIEIKFP